MAARQHRLEAVRTERPILPGPPQRPIHQACRPAAVPCTAVLRSFASQRGWPEMYLPEHRGALVPRRRICLPWPGGGHFRRSNYSERFFRPAADGWYLPRQGESARPAVPVLVTKPELFPGRPVPTVATGHARRHVHATCRSGAEHEGVRRQLQASRRARAASAWSRKSVSIWIFRASRDIRRSASVMVTPACRST